MGCPLCSIDPAIVAAALAGVSQRAGAAALNVPRTTLLRHLAEHGATVQPPAQAGPVVFTAAPATTLASVPSTAPASPVVALTRIPAPANPSLGGRPCSTCISPHRAAIDTALARGLGYKPIERLYRDDGGPSDTSIRHHAQNCVPATLAAAADLRAQADIKTATTVSEELDTLLADAKEALTAAKAGGSHGERSASIREFRQAVELLARVRGEIGADVEIKLVQAPQWTVLRDKILDALNPYPDALASVVAALSPATMPALNLGAVPARQLTVGTGS